MHHTISNLDAPIDSGADESLMDWGLAEELGIKSELVANPLKASIAKWERTIFHHTHQQPIHMHIKVCVKQQYICVMSLSHHRNMSL